MWLVGPAVMYCSRCYVTGCVRLMANGDYWGLMGIYFHAINLSWGLMGIMGD